MTEHIFSLVPFHDSYLPQINVAGKIKRNNNRLTVQFLLSGNPADILIPEPVLTPGRKNELWLATCFEIFLARWEEPGYWEFNLSPSGDWNIFHMDAYRRVGFQREDRIQKLQFETIYDDDCFRAAAEVDLSPIIRSEDRIQAGVTSVIQTRDGYETYWALSHPAPQADFHLRESFILEL